MAWDVAKAEKGKHGGSKGRGTLLTNSQKQINPNGQVPIISKTLLTPDSRTGSLLSNMRSDSENENHKQNVSQWPSAER